MRNASIDRKTKETDISVKLDLDSTGCEVSTGIGFFDHMLTALSVHGGFALKLKAVGDLNVDAHHTVEDCGIVIGKALNEALGDKSGITRYGSSFIPMDESLALAAVDVSGRPYLVFDADFNEAIVGEFDSCLCEEFFRALAVNAGITLHIKLFYGSNAHHEIEAIFKAVAHALNTAFTKTDGGTLSTKGVL
ncbi:MAG: imidazoleglycerol-phosphate dehydratase HisB [Clostridiales bacterium]|nr:imidazoleglycerol-phosphate dehydratase HisB [Clostridiales bacterium]